MMSIVPFGLWTVANETRDGLRVVVGSDGAHNVPAEYGIRDGVSDPDGSPSFSNQLLGDERNWAYEVMFGTAYKRGDVFLIRCLDWVVISFSAEGEPQSIELHTSFGDPIKITGGVCEHEGQKFPLDELSEVNGGRF